MSDIGITRSDVRRCNRLRGLGIATCSCRTEGGWLECPPGAIGVLSPALLEACRSFAEPVVPATAFIPPATLRRQQYTGNSCSNCGSLEMVRTGACETCQVCGESGGCA